MRTGPAVVAFLAVLVATRVCPGEEHAMADSAGLATKLAAVGSRSTCRITTRGRKSGKPHTVTIWFLAEGTTIYLATLNAKRDWVRNLEKTPEVVLDLDGVRVRGRASTIADPGADAHVRDLLARKYWMAWLGSWFGQGPERTFRVDGLEAA